MKYRVGSVFSGIGGIDLAFERAGFQITFQVEIDEYCNRVLERHWPNVTRRRDVRGCSAQNLSPVDVLVGGFPCQDISDAGQKEGIKEGNRSGLWFEYARIIGDLRPRYVFIENVPAITSRGGQIVLNSLTKLGYDAEWGIIPASAVGAPHRRARWYCVAYTRHWRLEAGNRGSGNPATEEISHDRPVDSDTALAYASSECDQRQQRNAPDCEWPNPAGSSELFDQLGYSSQFVAHADGSRRLQPQGAISQLRGRLEHSSEIMAHTESQRGVTRRSTGQGQRRKPESVVISSETVVNTTDEGLPQRRQTELYSSDSENSTGVVAQPERSDWWQTQSVLGRAIDGLSRQLDRTRWPAAPGQEQHWWEAPRTVTSKLPNRPARLKALGNAVVPQVVQPIAESIHTLLEEADHGSYLQEPE